MAPLREAIRLCRQVSLVEFHANVMIELARCIALSRPGGEDDEEVWGLLREALRTSRKCGYRVQEADVHFALAEIAALRRASFEDSLTGIAVESVSFAQTVKREAEQSLMCAECNGGRYVYRRVYEDGRSLLDELGRLSATTRTVVGRGPKRPARAPRRPDVGRGPPPGTSSRFCTFLIFMSVIQMPYGYCCHSSILTCPSNWHSRG